MASKFSGITALLTMAPSAFASGDISPAPRIKSLAALKTEVGRWGKEYFGRLSRQDIDTLAAWLNQNFFRLEK
jgi:hypothetical protein